MNEGSAFQDDPHPGMPMAVDSPLVSFGVAKPAFQIEVVLRQVGRIPPCKESGLKTGEDLGHLLGHDVRAGLQLLLERSELRCAGGTISLGGVEGGRDAVDDLDLPLKDGQVPGDGLQAAVNALGQPL